MFHQLVLLSDGKVINATRLSCTKIISDLMKVLHSLQVSYSDVPDKAYEVFVSALTSSYLKRGLVIPSLVKVHNPAGIVNLLGIKINILVTEIIILMIDVIMDMLGNPKMRKIITQHYQNSEEPNVIREAIVRAR